MKYLITCLGLVLFISTAQAQTVTTTEEYKYLTVDYRKVVESGAQPLEGYMLEEVFTEKQYRYKLTAKKFIKGKKKVVAVSVVIHSQLSGNDYYLCIPFNNEILKDEYYEAIRNLDQHLVQALALFVSDVLVTELDAK